MKKKYLFWIILFILIIFFLIIYVTFSINNSILPRSVFGDILEIDEDAYGTTVFDNSKLDLRPILDNEINDKFNNVIYIEFNVGGSKENTKDNIVYDIALNDLEVDCDLLSKYVKWKLVKNDYEVFEGSLDYNFDTIVNGRLVLTNIQQDLVPYNDNKNVYDHYKFYLWLSDSCQDNNLSNCINSEDQSNILGKKIKGKIEVELYGDTKEELIRKPSNKLDSNTCLNK